MDVFLIQLGLMYVIIKLQMVLAVGMLLYFDILQDLNSMSFKNIPDIDLYKFH